MKDPAKTTNCFEIVKATNKSATSIQDLFHKIWLASYLRPQFIVFDNRNGGEFKAEFKRMCENYGIKAKPTNYKSKQSIHKQKQSLSKNTQFIVFDKGVSWQIQT
jgi:hypothetical protein